MHPEVRLSETPSAECRSPSTEHRAPNTVAERRTPRSAAAYIKQALDQRESVLLLVSYILVLLLSPLSEDSRIGFPEAIAYGQRVYHSTVGSRSANIVSLVLLKFCKL